MQAAVEQQGTEDSFKCLARQTSCISSEYHSVKWTLIQDRISLGMLVHALHITMSKRATERCQNLE